MIKVMFKNMGIGQKRIVIHHNNKIQGVTGYVKKPQETQSPLLEVKNRELIQVDSIFLMVYNNRLFNVSDGMIGCENLTFKMLSKRVADVASRLNLYDICTLSGCEVDFSTL